MRSEMALLRQQLPAYRLKHKESMVLDMNDNNPVRIQRL